jgi:hypothetical protein
MSGDLVRARHDIDRDRGDQVEDPAALAELWTDEGVQLRRHELDGRVEAPRSCPTVVVIMSAPAVELPPVGSAAHGQRHISSLHQRTKGSNAVMSAPAEAPPRRRP